MTIMLWIDETDQTCPKETDNRDGFIISRNMFLRDASKMLGTLHNGDIRSETVEQYAKWSWSALSENEKQNYKTLKKCDASKLLTLARQTIDIIEECLKLPLLPFAAFAQEERSLDDMLLPLTKLEQDGMDKNHLQTKWIEQESCKRQECAWIARRFIGELGDLLGRKARNDQEAFASLQRIVCVILQDMEKTSKSMDRPKAENLAAFSSFIPSKETDALLLRDEQSLMAWESTFDDDNQRALVEELRMLEFYIILSIEIEAVAKRRQQEREAQTRKTKRDALMAFLFVAFVVLVVIVISVSMILLMPKQSRGSN